MTVVVVPGQFSMPPHQVGPMASMLMSVMVAGFADPQRFRRGKAYSSDGAVTRLEISPGRVVATVQGGRPTPYRTVIDVTTVVRPVLGTNEAFRSHLNTLSPQASELVCSCDCPDPGEPCKHAVATLLTLAHELTGRPELLLEWRCAAGADDGRRAELGSRARTGARHLSVAPDPASSVPAAPESPASSPAASPASPRPTSAPDPASTSRGPRDPWDDDSWRAFLGAQPPAPPNVDDEPLTLGHAMFGPVDLTAWLSSAHTTLSD